MKSKIYIYVFLYHILISYMQKYFNIIIINKIYNDYSTFSYIIINIPQYIY